MSVYVVLVILLGSFASSTVCFFDDRKKRRIKREPLEVHHNITNKNPLNPLLYGCRAVPQRIIGDERSSASLTKRPVMFDRKPQEPDQEDLQLMQRVILQSRTPKEHSVLGDTDEKPDFIWDTDAPSSDFSGILDEPIREADTLMFVHRRPDTDQPNFGQRHQPAFHDAVIHLSDYERCRA